MPHGSCDVCQKLVILVHLLSHVFCSIDIIFAFSHNVVSCHPNSENFPLRIELWVFLSFVLHKSPLLIQRAEMDSSHCLDDS
jgi:hypothetical protein